MVSPALFTSDISTSDSIRIATRGIGSQGEYGAVTKLAREFGISRPTVYERVSQGQEALGQGFGQSRRQKLLATVDVDESTLRRAVISAYTEGPNPCGTCRRWCGHSIECTSAMGRSARSSRRPSARPRSSTGGEKPGRGEAGDGGWCVAVSVTPAHRAGKPGTGGEAGDGGWCGGRRGAALRGEARDGGWCGGRRGAALRSFSDRFSKNSR
jgi:transposase-like protein